MEEVQSVVLETMSCSLKKNHMHMQVFEFSANQISAENNKA